jgi:hypothetical protein
LSPIASHRRAKTPKLTKRSKLSLYSPWIEYHVHILFIIYILNLYTLVHETNQLPYGNSVHQKRYQARFVGRFIQRVVYNDEYYNDLTQ